MPLYFVYALTGSMAGKFDNVTFANDAAFNAAVAAGTIQDPRVGAPFLLRPNAGLTAMPPIQLRAIMNAGNPFIWDFTVVNRATQAVINQQASFTFEDGTVISSATAAGSKTFTEERSQVVRVSFPDGRQDAVGFVVANVGVLNIAASVTVAEGNTGTTPFVFAVTRAGNTTLTGTANWVVSATGANPVNPTDFVGGIFPSGTVTFAPGATTQNITVNVSGDLTVETNETFAVTLSAPSVGTVIGSAVGIGTITNDDV